MTGIKNAVAKNVIVACGPSGAGKSSLIKRLLNDFPDSFGFSVSHTTRAPRTGEVHGIDYHYVTKEEFEGKIKRNEMVEYANVHTDIYGTSVEAVRSILAESKKCILDIDVQGVESVKASNLRTECKYLFIAPPSLEELEGRLRSRGTETEAKILTRLKNAKKEMEYKERKSYWDCVVVNDDLDRAYEQFSAFMTAQN